MTFSEKLKQAMQELHLNQRQVCGMTGKSKGSDCFSYYSFNSKNKVAEVIALGEVDTDGKKLCTNKIQIVREIPWQELLTIVNTGKDCTGLCNTGKQ